ncbi:mitochondrial ribosomal death-associated protein 3-domain-containing protein [Mycena floridula]|nr:mitochondrial ribosomal death-associated protein 3-domain-containing protein [Mycena floridula]
MSISRGSQRLWCYRDPTYIQARSLSSTAILSAPKLTRQQPVSAALLARREQAQTRKRIEKSTRIGLFLPMNRERLTDSVLQPPTETLNLPEFSASQHLLNRVVRFETSETGPRRWYGVPKSTYIEHRLLSQPASVVREITLATADLMDDALNEGSMENRFVLTGKPGCGKSYTLMQAVHHCHLNDWIVIYIPRAQNLVNSTTMHSYDLRTQTYIQPEFAQQLLKRIYEVNKKHFHDRGENKGLRLTRNYSAQGFAELSGATRKDVNKGSPLVEVVSIGIESTQFAASALQFVMIELGSQNSIPVLLAIDSFQSLYCQTLYRDPHFARIRSYHLAIPRLLLEFASGQRLFRNGAVLGAVCSSDPNFPMPPELETALDIEGKTTRSPYDKFVPELAGYSSGLQTMKVPDTFNVAEATAIFEAWMKNGASSAAATDDFFLAKYTESSGNPREFVWKGILSSLEGSTPPSPVPARWPQFTSTI